MRVTKVQELLKRHSANRVERRPIDLRSYIRMPVSSRQIPENTTRLLEECSSINKHGLPALKLKLAQLGSTQPSERSSNNALKGLLRGYINMLQDEHKFGCPNLHSEGFSNVVSQGTLHIDDRDLKSYAPGNESEIHSVCPFVDPESRNVINHELEYKLLKYEGFKPPVVEAVRVLQNLLLSRSSPEVDDRGVSQMRSLFVRNGQIVVGPAYLSFLLHRVKTSGGLNDCGVSELIDNLVEVFSKSDVKDLGDIGRITTCKASNRTLINDLSLDHDIKQLLASVQVASEGLDGSTPPIGRTGGLIEARAGKEETSGDKALGSSGTKLDPDTLERMSSLNYSEVPSQASSRDKGGEHCSITVSHLSCEALGSFLNACTEQIRALALELECNPNMLTVEESSFILDELQLPYSVEFKESRSGVSIYRSPRAMVKRSLVVTIMGHVDHGKTTLLDVLQKSDIASGEAGLITQKLGAFKVTCDKGTLVFVDTPGHAAFGTMRNRGGACADVAILVVAADDGVMPQTMEAIDVIRRERLPFIVAVNKVDINGGLHVRGMLENCGLDLTDVPLVYISAKFNHNIDKLKDELFSFEKRLNLMVDATLPGSAYIFETAQHSTWGGCLRAIVRNGVIKEGGWMVCGEAYVKIKRMFDADWRPIKVAMPSDIVQLNWPNDISSCAGLLLHHCNSQARAQKMAAMNKRRLTNAIRATSNLSAKQPQSGHVESPATSAVTPNMKRIPEIGVVLRCGDQGGLDAVMEWISAFNERKRRDCNMPHLIERGYIPECASNDSTLLEMWHPIRVVAKNVGPFTRSDSQFVEAGIRAFLGFTCNVAEGVCRPPLVVTHDVIYELFSDIEQMFDFYFGATHVTKTEATMHVTQVGSITIKGVGKKQAIGTTVTSGTARLNNPCMLLRDGKIISENIRVLSMQSSRAHATELIKGNCNNCIVFKELAEEAKVGDEIVSYTKQPLPPLFGIVTNYILD